MTCEWPIIEVEATFLSHEAGGRRVVPSVGSGRYMPHLVVQSPEVRTAITEGRTLVEDYLGVAFVAGLEPVVAGQPGRFIVELICHPAINYDALEVEATFTIREGGRIVGYGAVVQRTQPASRALDGSIDPR